MRDLVVIGLLFVTMLSNFVALLLMTLGIIIDL